MGGMVGQGLAIRHPELLRGVVLANTTARYPEAARPAWATRIAAVEQGGMAAVADAVVERYLHADYRAAHPAEAAALRAKLLRADPAGYVAACHAVANVDWLDRLSAVRTPTLVIAGARDAGATPEMARAIAERIAGAELARLRRRLAPERRRAPAQFPSSCNVFLAWLPRLTGAADIHAAFEEDDRPMPSNANDTPSRFGSGRAIPRVEDGALLVGRGRFVDNVASAGAATIAFQRSPHAHARIVAIDADAARAMPGVLAVYTGAELAAAGVKPMPTTRDFRRADGRTTVSPPRRALAHEFARYVGEAVVAVVAESREAARDAIDSVVVEYEELPAVADVAAATARRRARGHARGAPTTSPPRCAMATPRRPTAAFARAARAGRARHRQPARRAGARSSRAASSPRSTRRAAGSTVRISNQMPTAVAARHRRRRCRGSRRSRSASSSATSAAASA